MNMSATNVFRTSSRIGIAVAVGLLLTAVSSESQAQTTWIDRCPADAQLSAQSSEDPYFFQSPDASYGSRPNCPSYVVDVTDARRATMQFTGAVARFYSESDCNGAVLSWVAGYPSGFFEYTQVGFGASRGRWVVVQPPVGPGGFCVFDLTSGTSTITLKNSPVDSFRLLLRTTLWGAPDTTAGEVGVNASYFP
jgi:hypothetical protein